jgi:hypothetical protein
MTMDCDDDEEPIAYDYFGITDDLNRQSSSSASASSASKDNPKAPSESRSRSIEYCTCVLNPLPNSVFSSSHNQWLMNSSSPSALMMMVVSPNKRRKVQQCHSCGRPTQHDTATSADKFSGWEIPKFHNQVPILRRKIDSADLDDCDGTQPKKARIIIHS